MLSMRSATLMIALVMSSAGGCFVPYIDTTTGMTPRSPRPAPGPGAETARDRPAVTKKRVASKQPPSTLIAQDGTRCTTTEDRYRMVEVGDEEWCAWTGGESGESAMHSARRVPIEPRP